MNSRGDPQQAIGPIGKTCQEASEDGGSWGRLPFVTKGSIMAQFLNHPNDTVPLVRQKHQFSEAVQIVFVRL